MEWIAVHTNIAWTWYVLTGTAIGQRDMTDDARAARTLLAEKEVFRDLEARATETHFARVRAGRVESVETSTLHLDVLRDLKRINSHVAAAAYPVLERLGELLPSRLRRDTDAEDSGSTATELRDGR